MKHPSEPPRAPDADHTFWAILLAAGTGTRLAAATGNIPKQFLCFRDAPLYWQSALLMSRAARIKGLVFVFPPERLEEERQRLRALDAGHALGLPWICTGGGALRQDSVWNGICALPDTCSHVLVHDAARPFASATLVQRLCDALTDDATGHAVAAIPGLPVTDTIKVVADGLVSHTPDRQGLYAVQTPQAFVLSSLRQAHQRAQAENWQVTDDAALLEYCHIPVRVVEGELGNRKLTTPEDLRMLESTVRIPCTGFGYDVHRFGPGRPLRLGGVPVPGDLQVQAHSDGDVLLHALMDAILGCAAAGDIGQHFPDTSDAFENADSAILLDDVLRTARSAGLRLVHADLTIITQKPKIAPLRKAIGTRVAALLGLDAACVNVKATTEEGLGFTGAGEGIKAVAVVTALRTTPTTQQGES